MATALRLLTILALAAPMSVGCSAMRNGPMTSVTPVTTENQRVGSVYLLRGWIGIFSTGIDKLGAKINDSGVHAQVFQEAQWSTLADTIIAKYKDHPDHEPIVIVGHSYGADDSILITRKLNEHNIKVDLVVTLDPVTPKKVPANIDRVYNLYQSSALDGLPFLRGIALTPDAPGPVVLENLNIRTDRQDLLDKNLDHFNIEKKEQIHADVIAQVLKACPTRSQWAASKSLRDPSRISVALANRGTPATPTARVSTPNGVTVTSTFATVAVPTSEIAAASADNNAKTAAAH